MKTPAHIALILLFSCGLTGPVFAQQSTPATPSTSSPQSSQDLPDSPGTQVPIAPKPTGPTAVFDTSMGRITCKLFSKEAPETVANFIGLAEGTKDWTNPDTKQKMHGKPLYD